MLRTGRLTDPTPVVAPRWFFPGRGKPTPSSPRPRPRRYLTCWLLLAATCAALNPTTNPLPATASGGKCVGATTGTGKVLLRVCGKCIGRRGFDPRPALADELERRRSMKRTAGAVKMDTGSCMGPCVDGPNVQLLVESGTAGPRVVVAQGMSSRETSYRCLLGVKDEDECRRACDVACQLAEGTMQIVAPPGSSPARATHTNSREDAERAERIARELAESRAYLAKREAAAGAANWRGQCG